MFDISITLKFALDLETDEKRSVTNYRDTSVSLGSLAKKLYAM
jgi:hypothetical protein